MTNGEKFKEVFGFGADGSRVIAVNETWWDCEFQNRKSVTKKEKGGNMSELKPCPFCGGYAHLDKAYSYFRDIVIYCEECDTVFTLDDCNATAEDIVNAWNRRAEDV